MSQILGENRYTAEELEVAVSALSNFYDLHTREGAYRMDGPSMRDFLRAGEDYATRLTADALFKIDQIIGKGMEDAARAGTGTYEHNGLQVSDLSFDEGGGETRFTGVARDAEGNPVCQMRWLISPRKDNASIKRCVLTFAECPSDDPAYSYSPSIGRADISRLGSGAQADAIAVTNALKFAKFIEAVAHFKGPLAENLKEVSFGGPTPYDQTSRHELNTYRYLDLIKMDNGLPGRISKAGNLVIIRMSAAKCFEYGRDHLDVYAEKLEQHGAVWQQGYLSHVYGKYRDFVVKSSKTGRLAVFTSRDDDCRLAWVERDMFGCVSKVVEKALKPGQEVIEAINGFIEGKETSTPEAWFDYKVSAGTEAVHVSLDYLMANGLDGITSNVFDGFEKIEQLNKGNAPHESDGISFNFEGLLEIIGPQQDFDDEVESEFDPEDDYNGGTLGL